jgi:hypothetical protein
MDIAIATKNKKEFDITVSVLHQLGYSWRGAVKSSPPADIMKNERNDRVMIEKPWEE